jgi:nucleotide-binding universal stress UspA family protein
MTGTTSTTIASGPLLFAGRESLRAAPLTLREILFPSDLSPTSDRAYDHARLLSECFGAHLLLYHALQAGPETAEPLEREMQHRLQRAAVEHLERRAHALPVRSDVCVERSGSAAHSLIDFIRRTQPDLVVMGTRGRTGLAHFVLGSVTEHVLQHTAAPTLCIREPQHGVALPYRRILVPTDLSAPSRRAFPIAAALAEAFDAEVLAVHAADVHVDGATWGITDAIERRLPSEQRLAAFLRPDMDGVRVRPLVELGSAWDGITRVAATERADLIVLSTHGEDSLADRWLGSHAERIVRQAPCPVLVV